MIIKKWDGGTSQWVAQSPKVNAADIVVNVGAGTLVSIFGGGTSSPKILPAYLPDSVFDSLFFAGSTIGTIGSAQSRGVLASDLITKLYEADAAGRSVVGYYWVITSAGTISALTGIPENFIAEGDPGDGEYATLQFKPQDGGTNTTANASSGTLEVGDWFVIEKVEGNGTESTPWLFTASVINNSFEVFTGATSNAAGTAGIVPGAAAGQQSYFLRGDATWALPVTYSISTEASQESDEAFIRLTAGGSGSGTDDITLAVGTTGTSNTAGLTIQQASDVITFKHADTSSQASVSNSGRTYIQGITLDEFGHITAISSGTETVTDTTYTDGNGIGLSGTTFSVAAGVGLTQEADGLKMTQPFISSATAPSTSYQVANNIWFDLN